MARNTLSWKKTKLRQVKSLLMQPLSRQALGRTHTHFHSQDAHVAVISGTLRLAFDANPGQGSVKELSCRSFVFVPANVEHTMGADVDTIIIGTAMGPWKTHENEELHHH